jgi:hypothetical protein
MSSFDVYQNYVQQTKELLKFIAHLSPQSLETKLNTLSETEQQVLNQHIVTVANRLCIEEHQRRPTSKEELEKYKHQAREKMATGKVQNHYVLDALSQNALSAMFMLDYVSSLTEKLSSFISKEQLTLKDCQQIHTIIQDSYSMKNDTPPSGYVFNQIKNKVKNNQATLNQYYYSLGKEKLKQKYTHNPKAYTKIFYAAENALPLLKNTQTSFSKKYQLFVVDKKLNNAFNKLNRYFNNRLDEETQVLFNSIAITHQKDFFFKVDYLREKAQLLTLGASPFTGGGSFVVFEGALGLLQAFMHIDSINDATYEPSLYQYDVQKQKDKNFSKPTTSTKLAKI